MPPALRKTLKIIGYPVGAVVAFVAVYLAVTAVLSRIRVAAEPVQEPAPVELFVRSNGVHVDLVVPVKTDQIDWSQQLPYAHVPSNNPALRYVAFGWGDKGFYLDTPTWADLKVSTALRAGFWLSTSAMHVTYLPQPQPGPTCVPLRLTRAQYARLMAYINTSFERDAAARPQWIAGHSYGPDDAFYEAHRTYSLLYTCNTWANNGLKAAGQPAALWTPFQAGILAAVQPRTP